MPFLLRNQQHQSTKGSQRSYKKHEIQVCMENSWRSAGEILIHIAGGSRWMGRMISGICDFVCVSVWVHSYSKRKTTWAIKLGTHIYYMAELCQAFTHLLWGQCYRVEVCCRLGIHVDLITTTSTTTTTTTTVLLLHGWVCLAADCGSKVRLFGQWAAANCAAPPSVIASQYATSEIVKRFWSWAWLM